LADFDRHHEAVFGARACKIADNVNWAAVRAVPDPHHWPFFDSAASCNLSHAAQMSLFNRRSWDAGWTRQRFSPKPAGAAMLTKC